MRRDHRRCGKTPRGRKKAKLVLQKDLERICEYLNCEPNDLYEWRRTSNALNTENHPLKALRRDENAAEFSKMVAEIPLDKIEQVKEILLAKMTNKKTDLNDRAIISANSRT